MCLCVCAQLWPTLCEPVDCSPPDSSVQGISQARELEWVATGVDCHAIFQGLFPIQGSKPCLSHLLHWQAGSLLLYHLGSHDVSVYFKLKYKLDIFIIMCINFSLHLVDLSILRICVFSLGTLQAMTTSNIVYLPFPPSGTLIRVDVVISGEVLHVSYLFLCNFLCCIMLEISSHLSSSLLISSSAECHLLFFTHTQVNIQ